MDREDYIAADACASVISHSVIVCVSCSAPLPSCSHSTLLRHGSTSILCSIDISIIQPASTLPNAGRLDVEVQITPLCHAKYTSTRFEKQEYAINLQQWLFDSLLSSALIDIAALVITPAVAAFCIRLSLLVLCDDGNLQDALYLAAQHTLRTMQLPQYQVQEDGEVVCISVYYCGCLHVAYTVL